MINEKGIISQDTIVLGAGCFWCVEAIFQNINGVISVLPGYSNGKVTNPTYREVCSGSTGHAEVAQIIYDYNIISLKDILNIFFQTHDPTTLNRQGADSGTQYRSGVFYSNEEQKKIAEIAKIESQKLFVDKIVTEIILLDKFYPAEDYHVNYFKNNQEQHYCKIVINPKIDKFKKLFKDKLKHQSN
ncbi:MAG: peptide-methionine (S)-S-oxide reductase MsrA [Chlorobi bacterium]|nr:peptide-methionine (S)-S-oxide reductase MsrA [Chlorobiota bacterium]